MRCNPRSCHWPEPSEFYTLFFVLGSMFPTFGAYWHPTFPAHFFRSMATATRLHIFRTAYHLNHIVGLGTEAEVTFPFPLVWLKLRPLHVLLWARGDDKMLLEFCQTHIAGYLVHLLFFALRQPRPVNIADIGVSSMPRNVGMIRYR